MSLKLRNLPLRQGQEDPCPRQGHTLTYISSLNSLLLLGGQSDLRMNDLYFLDLNTLQWRKQNSAGKVPQMICYHTAFYDQELDYFFVYGGEGDKGRSNEDIYCLQIQNLVWKKFFLHQTPPSRHQHTLCDLQNEEKELIVFGGISLPKNNLLNDVWILNYQNIHFNQNLHLATGMTCTPKQTKGDVPSPRRGHQAFVVSNYMYVFGGKCQNQKHDDFSIYQLDLSQFNWKRIKTIGQCPTPRSFFSLNYIDESRIIILGGQENKTNNPLNEVHQLNLEDFYWSQPFLGETKIDPRYNHSYATFPYQNTTSIGIMGGIGNSFLDMKLYILAEEKTNPIKFKIDSAPNYLPKNNNSRRNSEVERQHNDSNVSNKDSEKGTKNPSNTINFSIEKYMGNSIGNSNNSETNTLNNSNNHNNNHSIHNHGSNQFSKNNSSNNNNNNRGSSHHHHSHSNEINQIIENYVAQGMENKNHQEQNYYSNPGQGSNTINFNIGKYMTNPQPNPHNNQASGNYKNPFINQYQPSRDDELRGSFNDLQQEIDELEQGIKQEEEKRNQLQHEIHDMKRKMEEAAQLNDDPQFMTEQIQVLDEEYVELSEEIVSFFSLYNSEREYSRVVQSVIQQLEPLLQGQSQYTMSLDQLFQNILNSDPVEEQEHILQDLLQGYRETNYQLKEEQKANFTNLRNYYLQINSSVNQCEENIEQHRREAESLNPHVEKFFQISDNYSDNKID